MNKIFILVFGLTLILSFQASTQTTNSSVALNTPTVFEPTPHTYYMYISGITTGQEVAFLEDLIQKKAGVTYFLGNRFPSRYFLLKSMPEVTQDVFASWIGNKYTIKFYGEGEQAKEGAILVYYKTHKR